MPTDTTAFVLGGGGSHGDFEVGALQYFYGWALTPDIICGTSVGSLNGVKLAEGENAPGSTPSAPSGLAGLTAIWKSLQFDQDMWLPAPWQAQIKNSNLLEFMQEPRWAQGIAVGAQLFLATFVPFAGTALLIKDGADANQLATDIQTALGAQSIAVLDPMVTKLHQNVIYPLTIRLFMAVVSLDTGELCYVNERRQLLDRDLQLYWAIPTMAPVCEPYAADVDNIQSEIDANQALLDQATGSGKAGLLRQMRLLYANLATENAALQACLRQNPPQPLPVIVDVVTGAQASASIPVIFQPVTLPVVGTCVDGGVRAIVPVEAAVKAGATEVYAVVASASGVSAAQSAMSLVTGQPGSLPNFAGAGWPDIALRVANQIMTDEISRTDTNPPVGWGVPVTYVKPKFDIHDTMTIDPGYIRIRMAHGYMAAHDACAGKRQKPADPQTQADFLSTVRQTDEIIRLRTSIWQMEGHTASLEPVPVDLVSIRYAKRQLWTLVQKRLRQGGRVPADTSDWWYSWEAHATRTPTIALWDATTPFVPSLSDGNVYQEQSDDHAYLLLGGAKLHVTDMAAFTSATGASVQQPLLPDGSLLPLPTVPRAPADPDQLRPFEFPGAPQSSYNVRELSVPGTFYQIAGGAKLPIPVGALASWLPNPSSAWWVPAGALGGLPLVPQDGTILQEQSNTTDFYLFQGGAMFHLSAGQLAPFEGTTRVTRVFNGALAAIPWAPRDGALLRELSNPAVYLIRGRQRHQVMRPQVLVGLDGPVLLVPDGALATILLGAPIWSPAQTQPSPSVSWTWGDSFAGILGDGNTTEQNRPYPGRVIGFGEGIAVAAGAGLHIVALAADGTVWSWGNNGNGQVGDGTTTNRFTPVQVAGLSGVTAVAAGGAHSLALRSDGTVWAWGQNGFGELGDGTTTERHTPVQVSGLTGVVAIAAGKDSNTALTADGSVWAWGYNAYGELGDGTQTNRLAPVPVPGLAGIVAIARGHGHALALKADGTVWAWGNGSYGQIGNGTNTYQFAPVQVSGLANVVAISGGALHSLALTSDGIVWAWGWNNAQPLGGAAEGGQLGDGTASPRPTPIQVSGLSGVVAIAAGGAHSLALKADASVWAWGYNAMGQVGDGTMTSRHTPTRVSGLGGAVAIAAGTWHSVALA